MLNVMLIFWKKWKWKNMIMMEMQAQAIKNKYNY